MRDPSNRAAAQTTGIDIDTIREWRRITANVPMVGAAAALALLAGCGNPEDEAKETGPPKVTIDGPNAVDERSAQEFQGRLENPKTPVSTWQWTLKKTANIDVHTQRTGRKSTVLSAGDVIDNAVVEISVVVKTVVGFEASETIKVRINEIDAANLPRDPGTAGDASVLGIDSNQDGIRDDVEHAIHARHGGVYTNMKILRDGARSLQKMLGAAVAQTRGDTGPRMSFEKFTMCLVTYANLIAREEMKWIREQVVNTAMRKEALHKYWESLIDEKPEVGPPVDRNQCLGDEH